MDILQSAFLPLGAFWIALQTITSSVTFVNGMRETIVTGQYDGNPLSVRHRYAIRYDWILSMCGITLMLLTFSVVIFWLAYSQAFTTGEEISVAMIIVGVATFFGGILFILCGISDYRLIQWTLRDAVSRKNLR